MSRDTGNGAPMRAQGAHSRRRTQALLVALGVVPVVVTLAVPLYASASQRVAGIPVFYWYQLACLVLTAVCLLLALVVTGDRTDKRRGAAS